MLQSVFSLPPSLPLASFGVFYLSLFPEFLAQLSMSFWGGRMKAMWITLIELHHAFIQELGNVFMYFWKSNHADDVPGILLVILALNTHWDHVFRE